MRRSLPFFVLCLLFSQTGIMLAQAPFAFNFQAVIRDSEGNILADQEANLRITILKGEENGAEVFSEVHPVISSGLGVVNLKIGAGDEQTADFGLIEWSEDIYFLKVEIDSGNTGIFQELGTSQLLSVPYALFAQKAANQDEDWLIENSYLQTMADRDVAIGLDSPQEKLHVGGNLKIEDTLKFKGLEIPENGYYNPGQLVIGPNDIQIGFAKNSFGNILIGNSQYGKTVFDLNLTGSGNIGIGTDVFNQSTTAYQNVCLGLYSGYNLSTGGNNVFIGSSAGEHISIGYNNVCLGYLSGNGRNGGTNVFIGNRAGYAWNGGGSDNIIIGNYAGFCYNSSNSGNIFLGKNSGYEVDTDDNIFIGPLNTGRGSSGSRNIFIGYETGYLYQGSNTLLIDNKADIESTFIKGDMENDQLEINARLDVIGKATAKSIHSESLFHLDELSEFPDFPEEGDIIYLNDTLRFFTGSEWKRLW